MRKERLPGFTPPWFSPGSRNQRFTTLAGAHRTRVGIVGAGPAGIFTAYRLAEEGVHSIVVEQEDGVGGGIASVSGGMVCRSGDDLYTTLVDAYGLGFARRIYREADAAQKWLLGIIARESIPCQLMGRWPSYLVSYGPEDALIAKEYDLLAGMDRSIQIVPGRTLKNDKVTWAIEYPNEGALNPHMLLNGLLNTPLARQFITLFVGSKVTGVGHGRIDTADGVVHANHIVLATGRLPEAVCSGFPQVARPNTDVVMVYRYGGRPPLSRGNYLTLQADDDGGATPFLGPWYRQVGQQTVLLGSPVADCRVEDVDDFAPSIKALSDFRNSVLAGRGRKVRCWPGDCEVSQDGVPYVGFVPDCDGVMALLAMGGSGLGNAAIGANVVTDLIRHGEHPSADMLGFKRARQRIGLGGRLFAGAQSLAA